MNTCINVLDIVPHYMTYDEGRKGVFCYYQKYTQEERNFLRFFRCYWIAIIVCAWGT